jgi:hypothetical protein
MAILALLGTGLVGCAVGGSDSSGHITVQHILIAVKSGSPVTPFKLAKLPAHTQDEAKGLATQLLKEVGDGADFDKLAAQNSDDTPPGIYTMSDYGVPADPGEYPRSNVPLAFGNVSFSLKVGQVGVAPFDPNTNPAGYHIIKRIR